jgi:hypothetical protein
VGRAATEVAEVHDSFELVVGVGHDPAN